MVFLLNDSRKQIRDARLGTQNEGCGICMMYNTGWHAGISGILCILQEEYMLMKIHVPQAGLPG